MDRFLPNRAAMGMDYAVGIVTGGFQPRNRTDLLPPWKVAYLERLAKVEPPDSKLELYKMDIGYELDHSLAWKDHVLTTVGQDRRLVGITLLIQTEGMDEKYVGGGGLTRANTLQVQDRVKLIYTWDRSVNSSNSFCMWLHRMKGHKAAAA
ncbi:hypothetical protein MLD38_025166 [Melastoma candidum]|uniref:Uncharacterized protein n=1 Tax=Melastoma candidum TaxID=119954 RepID=A0ACB9NW81_9MYRT|nr:hypothetical protein MLD38_025166 [Melastoma candidum]